MEYPASYSVAGGIYAKVVTIKASFKFSRSDAHYLCFE